MLSEANSIAIAELVVYTPALAVAIFLSIKHGFGRSSGYLSPPTTFTNYPPPSLKPPN